MTMAVSGPLNEAATIALGFAALMTAAWGVHRLTGASGWIDAIWTFGVGIAGVWMAFGTGVTTGGTVWRCILVGIFVATWSLRLGTHIVARTLKVGDDPRYRKLIDSWGKAAPIRLFVFLQVQAAAGTVLAISIALAARAGGMAVRPQDALGVLLLVAALLGEAVADAEIAHFKADPVNHGKVCDVGLWRLSRHPNYVCEWLTWLAFAVIGVGPDRATWFALGAPAMMYWVLRYASGVPLLEAHMVRSRGDAFRAYQANTPIFFPRVFRR